MKHTETLNSRSWAREARRYCRIRKLSKAWKNPGSEYIHAWTHTIADLGWIQARPCYVYSRYCEETETGVRVHRRIEFTGGWIIKARPQDAKFLLSHRDRYKEFRVPGPVDLDKLARYMGTAERYLREMRRLTAEREALYKYINTCDVPATIREQAERLGLPMSYQDMSVEDCSQWFTIARTWAPKAPAPRTQA